MEITPNYALAQWKGLFSPNNDHKMLVSVFFITGKLARAAKGRFFHASHMVLGDIDREGYEEAVKGMYFSFSITPPEFGLVHERRDINRGLEGKEMLVEALKHVLEKNPDLDSIHIRVGDASLEKE